MGKQENGPAKGLSVAVCVPGDREVKHHVLEGDDELAALQKLVGGYIEKVCSLPWKNGLVLDVYVNEDGIRLGLPPNRLVRFGSVQVPVLGPIVISAADPKTGKQVSLDIDGLVAATVQAASWPLAVPR